MKELSVRKIITYLPLLGILVFLLFFARTDVFSTRSWKEFWNLGHIPLFIVLGFIVYRIKPGLQNRALTTQFVIFAATGFVVGLCIEFIQSFTHRNASLQDVMLDTLGALIAVTLFSNRIRKFTTWSKGLVFLLVNVLLVFACWRFVAVAWDESQAYRDFPLLSDFEYERELGRWTGNARRDISTDVYKQGSRSLKVSLKQSFYSGVELQYFPSDWSDYAVLSLQVFNPASESFSLTASIFDQQHKTNNFSYRDRYTDQFALRPGWNEIVIFLDEILNAPSKRQMDITHIHGLRLFVVKPSKGQYFYIDTVRLEN